MEPIFLVTLLSLPTHSVVLSFLLDRWLNGNLEMWGQGYPAEARMDSQVFLLCSPFPGETCKVSGFGVGWRTRLKYPKQDNLVFSPGHSWIDHCIKLCFPHKYIVWVGSLFLIWHKLNDENVLQVKLLQTNPYNNLLVKLCSVLMKRAWSHCRH